MGTFHVSCEVESLTDHGRRATVDSLLVDTGSECTWLPRAALEAIGELRPRKERRFSMANGQTITRQVVYALLRVGSDETTDEVVLAEPGDLHLLGARTLEGLGLRVDSLHKRLIPAGPAPAARVAAVA